MRICIGVRIWHQVVAYLSVRQRVLRGPESLVVHIFLEERQRLLPALHEVEVVQLILRGERLRNTTLGQLKEDTYVVPHDSSLEFAGIHPCNKVLHVPVGKDF